MKKLVRIGIIALLLCVLLACILSLLFSKYGLSVACYTMSSDKLTAPVRIVQLTDLHNARFGEDNARLLEKIAAQEPDLIVTTGDMLMQDQEDLSMILGLVENLVEIAPVYCSMGNHELAYEENFPGSDLVASLEMVGANVVHFSWVDVEVKGQNLCIGGLYGYALPEERYDRHGVEQRFLHQFEATDIYKVLLCHIPEGMLLWGGLDDWNIDLTFCGHVHGGVIRLPFIGGLYSQEEKFFPSFTAGMKEGKQGVGILSRGLGISGHVPRMNNIPEIVVVDIVASQE